MTRRIKWPMAVAIPDGHAVFIRYSTVSLSLHHSSLNMRLSLVSRALGLAVLAFCDDDEQNFILKALRTSTEPEDALARNATAVRTALSKIRARGYATRDPKVRPVSNTLAVPIFEGARVVASVGLTFFSSALEPKQAVHKHLDQLKDVAGEISTRLASLQESAKTPAKTPATTPD